MRERKQKRILKVSSSSSESQDYDSSYSDPDYVAGTSYQRSSRKNFNINPCINNPNQATEVGSSRRNNGVVATRRRRILSRRPGVSNKSNRGVFSKKRTILSWMIDLGIIFEDMRVLYIRDKEKIIEGTIKRDGVRCNCCHKVITVYGFEEHANEGHVKEPYAHIYLVDWGCHLLGWIYYKGLLRPEELARCEFNLVEPRKDASDLNDDACMICADGGDLICCEKCPSNFHPDCMGMKKIPQGEWPCPFCICKFCGTGGPDHLDCINSPRQPSSPDSPTKFCGKSCEEVFSEIQEKHLGVRKELADGYTWSLVQMKLDRDPHSNGEFLHEITIRNSKVSVAWTVMEEIFMPVIDRYIGINITQSVIYNRESNLRRVNFRGFYTAILERNDEFISVASIRVHGTKFAEMPFIGTRERFRGRRMLQKLLAQIESALRMLNVENLVIPSVPELVPMWINKYGFTHIENNLMTELIKYNTLMFPTAVRLHKSLVTHAAASAATKTDEANKNGTGLVRGKCCARNAESSTPNNYRKIKDTRIYVVR
ncbi:PHD-type domain-containing protein [Citrus sinensis]|nr:PHD-type domain-containing protein [Citrus sinensis]